MKIKKLVIILRGFLILVILLAASTEYAKACDEDDFDVYCDYRIYKPCMSAGNSINCCLK